MTDKKNNTDEEAIAAFEAEGIIIESVSARKELEQSLNTLQTKEEEKALFDAIGVEIPKKNVPENDPTTDTLKKELNNGGIEVLPTEPLDDSDL
ncbi:MAG TPA: hypothetical protein ENI61_02645 [Ignavibacteria bacterium]|mgnify:CR=1 FL=1|nr:hypothetical protein [Ignavibacteria bacterium]